MRLAFPQDRYDLFFQAPSDASLSTYRAFANYVSVAPVMPDYAPATQLSLHWQVGFEIWTAWGGLTAL